MEQEKPSLSIYALALVLTVICLGLANFVLAYLGELANMRAGTPAAAALAFVQGLVGAVLAGFASRQLFRSVRPADFWLKWIVIVVAAVFAVLIVWLLVTGKSGRALNWTTYAGIAALIGTEVGRRIAKSRFGRPGPGVQVAS